MTRSSLATAAPAATVDVDPRIAALVSDVARPTAKVPPCRELGHLPGPTGGLFRGLFNAVQLMWRGNVGLTRAARRYGRLYRDMIGFFPVVHVSDKESMLAVLGNSSGAWSAALGWRVFFDGIDPTSKRMDGLALLDFQPHREARRLLQPAFSKSAVKDYLSVATAHYEKAIDAWLRVGKVAFKAEARRMFAGISSEILMGIDDPEHAKDLDRALSEFWAGSVALAKNRWLSRSWRRGMRGHRLLRQHLLRLVPERRERGGTDLFSRLCQTQHELDWVTDETLVQIFMSILSGAFDTTSRVCASMAYLLARYPAWQERLRAECKSFGGDDVAAGIKTFEQLDWVWKETIRLYPVGPFVARIALRDVMLGKHRIPAGACVLAGIGTTLHDEDAWTDPGTFDPERFSPMRAEDRRLNTLFAPFGAGAHACIGSQLADLQVKAFWHAMLTRCSFRLTRPYDAHHEYRLIGSVSGSVDLTLSPS